MYVFEAALVQSFYLVMHILTCIADSMLTLYYSGLVWHAMVFGYHKYDKGSRDENTYMSG